MIAFRFKNIGFDRGIELIKGARTATIEATGHALYDIKGKDIVCSAVSALTQTVLLSLDRQCGPVENLVQEEGRLAGTLILDPDDAGKSLTQRVILTTLVIGLAEIEKRYPGTVTMTFER